MEVSERFADGVARRGEPGRVCRAAGGVLAALARAGRGARAAYLSARMARWAAADSLQDVAGCTAAEAKALAACQAMTAPARRAARAGESQRQCDLFRDIFGSPFAAPPRIDPSWLAWNAVTVRRPAEAISQERAFGRVPILADARPEAACDNDYFIEHCRSGREHARGCFVLDALRSKH